MAQPDILYKTSLIKYQLVIFCCIILCSFSLSAKTLNEAKQLIRLKNFTEAHKTLNQLATKGDHEAQYYLAVLYRNGHGPEIVRAHV